VHVKFAKMVEERKLAEATKRDGEIAEAVQDMITRAKAQAATSDPLAAFVDNNVEIQAVPATPMPEGADNALPVFGNAPMNESLSVNNMTHTHIKP